MLVNGKHLYHIHFYIKNRVSSCGAGRAWRISDGQSDKCEGAAKNQRIKKIILNSIIERKSNSRLRQILSRECKNGGSEENGKKNNAPDWRHKRKEEIPRTEERTAEQERVERMV